MRSLLLELRVAMAHRFVRASARTTCLVCGLRPEDPVHSETNVRRQLRTDSMVHLLLLRGPGDASDR